MSVVDSAEEKEDKGSEFSGPVLLSMSPASNMNIYNQLITRVIPHNIILEKS